jgi:hypothetical protein
MHGAQPRLTLNRQQHKTILNATFNLRRYLALAPNEHWHVHLERIMLCEGKKSFSTLLPKPWLRSSDASQLSIAIFEHAANRLRAWWLKCMKLNSLTKSPV